ncbi:MAG: succinate dehydrogenase, cytochrome b556 subunit [Hyphomicrobiales bacterium]|nr:succinate dehydrogenase, cytochrome b556 subunit [Hyphomicrobiales bacterium]
MNNPLSPHLSIYKFRINMMMSIAHRITGSAMYFGMILVLILLLTLSLGESFYNLFLIFLSTWIGNIILVGVTWALFHHMLGGIRHIIWDNVRGFDLSTIDFLASATLIGGILLTFVFWLSYLIV